MIFRDTDNKFELQGDLLKMITNNNYNVDLANLSDKKLLFDFAKEKYFDEKALGNKSTSDKSLRRLFNPTGIMAFGVSTIFSNENPDELCKRLNLLQQEKQAGIKSDIINEEFIAIVDKYLEYQCIYTKQHRFLL